MSAAPTPLAPVVAVATAFETTEIFGLEHREYAQQRQRTLNANTEVQERESMKLASLSAALA